MTLFKSKLKTDVEDLKRDVSHLKADIASIQKELFILKREYTMGSSKTHEEDMKNVLKLPKTHEEDMKELEKMSSILKQMQELIKGEKEEEPKV